MTIPVSPFGPKARSGLTLTLPPASWIPTLTLPLASRIPTRWKLDLRLTQALEHGSPLGFRLHRVVHLEEHDLVLG
jgi:hypothetical protein